MKNRKKGVACLLLLKATSNSFSLGKINFFRSKFSVSWWYTCKKTQQTWFQLHRKLLEHLNNLQLKITSVLGFSWHLPYGYSNRSQLFLVEVISLFWWITPKLCSSFFKIKRNKGYCYHNYQDKLDNEVTKDRLRKQSLIWAQLLLEIKPKWHCWDHWKV